MCTLGWVMLALGDAHNADTLGAVLANWPAVLPQLSALPVLGPELCKTHVPWLYGFLLCFTSMELWREAGISEVPYSRFFPLT